MPRRRRQGSALKREMGWSAYNHANDGSGFIVDANSVSTFVDWFKYPGGVFNSLTDAPEPINDTLAKILTWGSVQVYAPGENSVSGRVECYFGIIEWHGVSQAPPPDLSYPFPSSEPNAEWVWWLKMGGTSTFPGPGVGGLQPVTTLAAGILDWQYQSSAKRKLPENVGLLLVIDVVNDTDAEIAYVPSMFWRYLLHQGEIIRAAR